ncbi:MAG: hypothetical protein ABIS38_04005 [Sphingomicrobium sp.]
MGPIPFRILLALIVLYALVRGSRDERQVAIICLAGAAATTMVLSPMAERFQGLESPVLLVDLMVLTGFVMVALRSHRFWPLWVAGLQLTTIVAHLLKGIDIDLLPRAYAAALNFWAYPIIFILALGTYRANRRSAGERTA